MQILNLPTGIKDLQQVNAGWLIIYQIKRDTIQLDFDALFICHIL